MELVYAALLLHEADAEVTEENVQGVLEGAGIEVDDAAVKALVAALEDVDLDEAMEAQVATAAPAQGGASDEGDGEAEQVEEAAEGEGDEGGDEPAPEDEGASEEEAAEGLGSLF